MRLAPSFIILSSRDICTDSKIFLTLTGDILRREIKELSQTLVAELKKSIKYLKPNEDEDFFLTGILILAQSFDRAYISIYSVLLKYFDAYGDGTMAL